MVVRAVDVRRVEGRQLTNGSQYENMPLLHVISYRTLREFADRQPFSQEPLKTWYKVASKAMWLDIVDVKAVYPHADAVGKCTVFNVAGNDFRLVVQIDFEAQVIYVKKVMTRAEYSRKDGKLWKKSCNC